MTISIPIHHTTDPDAMMEHFDGAYNSPREDELDSFAVEYAAVHAAFTAQALEFFRNLDSDDISLSPPSFASTRKIGMVVDDPTFRCVSLTRWLTAFVTALESDYMITVDTFCSHGQAFLCFTRRAIWTFGDSRDMRTLGLDCAAFSLDTN